MTIQWGPWSGPSSNQMRMGIEVDAPSAGGVGTVSYHCESRYSVAKSVNLNKSGSLTGTTRFAWNQSGGARYIESLNFTFVQGGNYTFAASLSDTHNGATPSHAVSVSIAAAPSGPRQPYAPVRWPDLAQVTASSVQVTSMVPSNDGGAPIFAYQFQAALNEAFTDGLLDTGVVGGTHVASIFGLQQGRTYYFRTRAVNSVGYGDWSYASSAVTRLAPPWRPSGLTLGRNSDAQLTLNWGVNYPSGEGNTIGPVWAIAVERTDNVQTAWVRVATLTGTPSSWVDTGTVANRRYGYRIAAWNKDGQSDWWTTGYISTTPAGSWWASAAREGSGIRVTWDITRSPQPLENWTIERSTNGVWASATAVAPGSGASQSWLDPSPVAGATHAYRVKAVSLAEPSYLSSGWQGTGNIVALVAPNAPAPTGPSGPQDPAADITLTWQHNAPDTSAQRIRQVRWRYQGVTAWTTLAQNTSSVQSWTIAAGTWLSNRVVEWQVLTYGTHASASPWSATATVVTSTPPTAAINTPGALWDSPVLTVTWGYHDADGHAQAAYQVGLRDSAGVLVEPVLGNVGVASSHAFATTVRNGESYTVLVRVQDSTGMWSDWVSQAFAVAYPEPPQPVLTGVWDANRGACMLTIVNPPGTPAAIRNDLERSIEGGAWEMIAVGLPPNSVVADLECAVVGATNYRVTAWSALPSTAASDEISILATGPLGVWVSAGPGSATMCRGLYGVKVTREAGRAEKVLQRFAGETFATEFTGPGLERSFNVSCYISPPSGRIDPIESSDDEWVALAEMVGPHLFRDSRGRRFWGSMSSVSVTEKSNGGCEVSFSITETGRK